MQVLATMHHGQRVPCYCHGLVLGEFETRAAGCNTFVLETCDTSASQSFFFTIATPTETPARTSDVLSASQEAAEGQTREKFD